MLDETSPLTHEPAGNDDDVLTHGDSSAASHDADVPHDQGATQTLSDEATTTSNDEQRAEQEVASSESSTLLQQDKFFLQERPTIERAGFLPPHPGAETHELKCNRFLMVPNLRGPYMPRKKQLRLEVATSSSAIPSSDIADDGQSVRLDDIELEEVRHNRERYGQYALALFHPWRCAADLQVDGSYWSKFSQWSCPKYVEQFLQTMEELVSSKARDPHVEPTENANKETSSAPEGTTESQYADGDDEAIQATLEALAAANDIAQQNSQFDPATRATSDMVPDEISTEPDQQSVAADHVNEEIDEASTTTNSMNLSRNACAALKRDINNARKSMLGSTNPGGQDSAGGQSSNALAAHTTTMNPGNSSQSSTWQALDLPTRVSTLQEALAQRAWKDGQITQVTSQLTLEQRVANLKSMPTVISLSEAFGLNKEQHEAFAYMSVSFLRTLLNSCTIDLPSPNHGLDATMQKTLKETIEKEVKSLDQFPTQLIMHLAGQGGCGKSHVIAAIRKFVQLWGFADGLIVTASTGAAAALIAGLTIHSAIGLSRQSDDQDAAAARRAKEGSQSLSREKTFWNPARLLIIDECSMIGLGTLGDICAFLNKTRGCTSADAFFGGLHVVFVGDFMQLPPVQDPALYTRASLTPSTRSRIRDKTVIKRVLGQRSWRAFNTFVTLTHNVRAQGDGAYAAFLDRLRENKLHHSDIDRLKSRIVGSSELQDNIAHDTTIITVENVPRNQLNYLAVLKRARDPKYKVFKIPGVVTPAKAKSKDTVTPSMKRLVRSMDKLTANKNAGILGVYNGMPVVVTMNICVLPYGIANGSLGVVEHVQWANTAELQQEVEADGSKFYMHPSEKQPMVIIIRVAGRGDIHLPPLPKGMFPIFPSDPIVIKNADNRPVGRMSQFPIVPAFAFTGHKIQGRTLNSMLVHYAGHESITHAWLYSVLSRVKSWHGLFLTRDFTARLTKMQMQPDLQFFMTTTLPRKTQESSERLQHELNANSDNDQTATI